MATNDPRDQPQFIEAPAPTYQPYQPSILERDVIVYLISESELGHISSANPLVTLFTSAFFFFAATAGSFWIAGETAGGAVSERAEAIFDVIPIVVAVMAALCACAAGVLWKSSQSMLKKIKEESRRPAHLVSGQRRDDSG